MSGPLTGYKIIEIAGIGPGPFAAMLLADMGAEIIRVEDQDGMFWMWAVVNTDAELEDRNFLAFKTGAKMPDNVSLKYIGFCKIYVQMELGLYIFEVIQ